LQQRAAVIGTIGNGIAGQLVETRHTTPDAVRVQHLLYEWANNHVSHVTMEVSSHGLSQARVAEVAFRYAVFTNLSHDHLDYHGDMASYAEAKALLFAYPNLKAVVLNADDPYSRIMAEKIKSNTEIYYYSMHDPYADITIESLRSNSQGFDFMLNTPWGRSHMVLPLLGLFNVSNTLAVIATLGAMGYPLNPCLEAMQSVKAVPGRMEPWVYPNQPTVVIDYAHTPAALKEAL
jgi:UDP-N-acetylmuramoyl-L-alanyl-D-glutamate--2,6-diaminopimelate ligase